MILSVTCSYEVQCSVCGKRIHGGIVDMDSELTLGRGGLVCTNCDLTGKVILRLHKTVEYNEG
jgi:hypothetical protein